MSDCAICYVADEAFLFPAIASALSLRAFVPEAKADVLLFLTSTPKSDELASSLKALGIKLMILDVNGFSQVDASKWSRGHVTVSTLGRFLIADAVAQSYRRMLYVDGDTYFGADPSALLNYAIPAGKIGAVDDIRAYARQDFGRFGTESRRYFSALGMPGEQRYFNAGMFLVETATWQQMAKDAHTFFLNNTEICDRHDQSSMNSVLGRHRVPLPARYNFMTEYENLGLSEAIEPVIYHFTGSTKPWVGPLDPWKRFFPFYADVEQRIAHIVKRPAWSAEQIAEQNATTRKRYWKMHLMFAHRVRMKRRAILQRERAILRSDF
jgi:lipopolysaccharide biosynthesis glycosyltransferase